MIPKIIHYCWFGNNPMPKLLKKCMKSWKKYCPEYEIIEWNESNFNIENAPQYIKDAYAAKKWAFVADYARLWIIFHYGGIYLDTDVELLKSLDPLLIYDGFFGCESQDPKKVATGLGFGAIKGLGILSDLMRSYDTQKFIIPNLEKREFVPNTWINWPVFESYGVERSDTIQIIDQNIAIFPGEYFDPMISYLRDEINITENTYSIHHYTMTWDDNHEKKIRQMRIEKHVVIPMKLFLKKILGVRLTGFIKRITNK